MDRLVGRMLELAALENRRVLEDTHELPVKEWVGEAMADLRPLAEQRGVVMTARGAGDQVVRGDGFLLRQALGNLLENAIDFSPPGSDIIVAWESHGGSVRFTVEDSGPGIPDYALDRVFEKFFSLPSLTRFHSSVLSGSFSGGDQRILASSKSPRALRLGSHSPTVTHRSWGLASRDSLQWTGPK
jgi:two-component system sensor histidine kinase CreC